jgi:LacI family transcriptional regulator
LLGARARHGPARDLAPGRRPPRLKDVAAAAGVHPATASRALNEHTASLLSPQTAERVRQAAERLGYRVNRMARALKTRRSLAIGMLVPDITNPFFPPIVKGAEDALAGAGYTLVLANTDNDEAKERLQLGGMLQSQVDGLLMATARRRAPAIEQLRAGPVPLVLVNRTIDRGGISAVIPDDHAGALLAVEHLHQLGHRRIGHVAGPQDTSTGARRAKGFTDAMRALGLPTPRIARARLFNEEEGRRAAAVLLARRPRVTAIVAANDLLALGVLDAAAAAGLRCPEDVSIIGVNDVPLADRLQPPLTTIRVAEYDLGRQAARLLLAHIDDPERVAETVVITPELIVRGSTAAPVASPSVRASY